MAKPAYDILRNLGALSLVIALSGCTGGQALPGYIAHPQGLGSTTTGGPDVSPSPAPSIAGGNDTPALTACPANAPAPDVMVTINASQGPGGSAQPVTIDRRFYSMNMADWMPQDYGPPANAQVAAFLHALHPGLLRWPAGHTSQHYIFTRTGTVAAGANNLMALTPAMVDAFVAFCKTVDAQPYLAVNLKTGTPEQAADLVKYVNTEQHDAVTWWQMGNEPDNLDGLTKDANDYATHYTAFAPAMRAVDANIKLVGAELLTGAHVIGSNSQTNWLLLILAQNGAMMDAIAWHYYPMDSSNTDPNSSASASPAHLLAESATDWVPAGMNFPTLLFPTLKTTRDAMAPKAELWVDEFAEDSGPANGAGLSDTMTGAIWAADEMGRFAEQGVNAMFHFLFHSVEDHKFALLDGSANPRAEYYTYWMYAQLFGDQVVASSSSKIAQLAAHAATLKSDGSLRVILVNKDSAPHVAQLAITGYTPVSGSQYVLSASATGAQINGQALTAQNVAMEAQAIPATAAPACTSPTVTVPAMSAMMLVFAAH